MHSVCDERGKTVVPPLRARSLLEYSNLQVDSRSTRSKRE